MGRIIWPLYEAVITAQEEAPEMAMAKGGRRKPQWLELFLTVAPDKMAALILQSAFNTEPRDRMTSFQTSRVAKNISTNIHMQIGFDMWEEGLKTIKKADHDAWTELDYLTLHV